MKNTHHNHHTHDDHSAHENHDHSNHEHHDHASMMASPEAAKDFLKRFAIVTILLIPLAIFSTPAVNHLGAPDFAARAYLELAIVTAIFAIGFVFFRHAKMEIQMRQYGMMTLVSMGIGAGYLFSIASTFIPAIEAEFYIEIATLVWVLLFGHFLEAKSSTAAGDALREVAKLLPKKAHLKTGTTTKEVDLDTLKQGDIVIVKAGEKVPADGTITNGHAAFNESHITGESRPVEKKESDQVVAGAININGSVEVTLSRVGESSTIGQIQKLISSAKQTKPTTQKVADRASRWLTFSALSVAILTLIVWSALVGESLVFSITLAITVLVIACPHALGLAIPTVSTIATRLAVKNGIFIKDLAKIEIARKADYVVFDKTGTLTTGEFSITAAHAITTSKDELIEIAASIESQSSHVLGIAIATYATDHDIAFEQATDITNIAGKGMSGTYKNTEYLVGNSTLMKERDLWTEKAKEIDDNIAQTGATPVFVASTTELIGVIALGDTIKPESANAIRELHDLDVKVAMLTGDTQAAADRVATKLGIDKVFAQVLPEDKYAHIKDLQSQGNIVIMAGDGVNDAPALTQADVGVAIGTGTDVAAESGDIILTKSNPEHLVRLITLSRRVYRKMLQNLWWALGYNVLAIPAAAGLFIPLGFRITPAVGALLMSLSSVIVVINALTLLNTKLTSSPEPQEKS